MALKILKHPPSSEQHRLADTFLELCPHFVKDDNKERYITLDVMMGKSKRNKNAISIHSKNVSFMVMDWSQEDVAQQLGFETRRGKKLKRLEFLQLTPKQISQNREFFSTMSVQALRAAQMKQGYNHFAFSGNEIVLENIVMNGKSMSLKEAIEWMKKAEKGNG